MVVERHITHIAKLRQAEMQTPPVPLPMTEMHPLHLAADRIVRRTELIESGDLTQSERGLQGSV